MSKAPIETWAFWAPLVLAIVCLLTGVILHRFAFPSLEKNLYVLSKRLHDYPLLVLITEETVAHALVPSLSRFILLGCIYGKAMGGLHLAPSCSCHPLDSALHTHSSLVILHTRF